MARRRPRKYTFEEQLRDPNKRKKIPTSKLPAKYRGARKARIQAERDARDPLLNPGIPLTGGPLRKAATSLTDAELNPALDALARQGRDIGTQHKAAIGGTASIYRELAQRELDNVARQQALSEMTRRRIADIGQANVSEADRVGLAAQQAMETVSGPLGSAPDRLAAERTALTGRANAQSANWRQAAELAGLGHEQFTDAMGQARSLRGAESIERLATRMVNQQGEVGAKRTDLAASRGDLLTGNILKLRQQGFENAAVEAANNIKIADLRQEAKDNRAGRRTQYSGQRTQKQIAEDNRRAADRRAAADREQRALDRTSREEVARQKREADAAKARVKAEKNEPAHSVAYRRDIEGGRSLFRRLEGKGKKKGLRGPDLEKWVKNHMIRNKNIPPAAYNAIYDLERRQSLHPANAAALEALGVVVPPAWLRRRRPRPSRNSPSERAPGGT